MDLSKANYRNNEMVQVMKKFKNNHILYSNNNVITAEVYIYLYVLRGIIIHSFT